MYETPQNTDTNMRTTFSKYAEYFPFPHVLYTLLSSSVWDLTEMKEGDPIPDWFIKPEKSPWHRAALQSQLPLQH